MAPSATQKQKKRLIQRTTDQSKQRLRDQLGRVQRLPAAIERRRVPRQLLFAGGTVRYIVITDQALANAT